MLWSGDSRQFRTMDDVAGSPKWSWSHRHANLVLRLVNVISGCIRLMV